MPIDPSISLKVDNPGDIYAQTQQKIQGRQQDQLNQAKLAQIPLQQQTAQLDLQSKQADMQRQQLADAKQKIDIATQLLSGAVDQPSYDTARQKAASLGLDISNEPTVFDPEHVKQSQMALMGIKDKINLQLAQQESALKQSLLSARTNTEQAQQKSYDALTDQRKAAAGSFDALAQQRNAVEPASGPELPQGVLPPPTVNRGLPVPNTKLLGKAPAGYRWTQTGDLEPIPGGPRDPKNQFQKPPNEQQANAALYADRMTEAHNIIDDLSGRGYKPGYGQDTVAGIPGGNLVLSSDTQKYQQAKRNFINAVLRRESGAAISPSEFESAEQQYFPQPGQDKETIEQKRKNRETAIKGIANAAGGAAKNIRAIESTISHDAIDAELAKRRVK